MVASVRSAGAQLQASGRTVEPAAIALSCRGGTGVWLDGDGQFIEVPEVDDLGSSFASDEIYELYGSDVWGPEGPFGYGYAPATLGRVLWLRRHRPDAFTRLARIGALHDWVILKLCGVWASDPATGTSNGPWPAAAVALTGLPADALPRTLPQDSIAGGLATMVAAELGLPPGAPVVVGCHDGVAANIGCGTVRDGDTCITLGSNLVVRAVTGHRVPEAFGYPILEHTWAWVRGVHGIAAQVDAVVAVLDGLGTPVGPDRHMALTTLAEAVGIEQPVIPLPSLPRGSESLRAQQARDALAAGHSPGAIYRATLAGSAESVAALVNRARGDGADCRRFVVTGATAGNRLMLSILSAMLGTSIEVGEQEAGLLGAAILAAVAAGIYPNVEAAIGQMVRPGQIVDASEDVKSVYSGQNAGFRGDTSAAPGDRMRRHLT